LGAFDRISTLVGRATSWLTLAMVIVMFVVVVMRYAFDFGFIWLQESVTWMHAVVFMLGAAYTLHDEEHVRVDVFYGGASDKRKAWVNLLGVLVFLLPLCAFLAYEAWDFVTASWSIKESSRESGGLPYPFLPILKTTLLLMPLMVAMQGVSLLLRSVASIRGR
jgi:TRAP-type mannitol/chloroaromatic compound transport system permease small subunit